jgi:hypothetical protein
MQGEFWEVKLAAADEKKKTRKKKREGKEEGEPFIISLAKFWQSHIISMFHSSGAREGISRERLCVVGPGEEESYLIYLVKLALEDYFS